MMKKLVFLSFMFMGLLLPQNIHAQTAIGYAVLSEDSTTLTFMYGTPTGDYFPTEYINYPGWNNYNYNHPVLSKITSIVFDPSFANARPSKCSYWFYGLRANTTIEGIENLNTSNVKSMRCMFYQCGITSFDLSHFDTSNVTDMGWMFAGSKIKNPDVSHFNTSKVTTMEHMFMDNKPTTSLDVSNWDTSKVTTMRYMFGMNSMGEMSLASLDVSNWNTSSVTIMEHMFDSCTKLTSLDVSHWNTSKVTNFQCMFYGCSGFTSIDVSKWDTSKATNFQSMFYGCSGLTSIDVSKWDTSEATTLGSIFSGCSGLTSIDVSKWDTSKATTMGGMFYGCTNLTSITFGENFSTAKATGTRSKKNMFNQCSNLRYINSFASNYTDAINYSSGNMMSGIPKTTVIYLPHGSQLVTDRQNVVYSYNGDETDLRCPKYYSVDKVDIEFPRDFKTNEAVYSRTMGSKEYGSVVLPYDFTSNDDIQAYSLSEQYNNMSSLKFTDTQTVPAHTPFAFKRLNKAEFLMKDDSENFGITVHATRSTNAAEKTLLATGDLIDGSPYEGTTGLSNWKTKGYYVKETVTDYDGMYFIQDNNFKRATGNLNLVDHRVLFYPTDATGASKFFTLSFSDDEMITAIEAAETEQTLRQAEGIYDATGRQQTTAHRGLNIVRMSDGTVKKVIVK